MPEAVSEAQKEPTYSLLPNKEFWREEASADDSLKQEEARKLILVGALRVEVSA